MSEDDSRTLAAFVREIEANPGDPTTLLIYADWIEEQTGGPHPLAQLLRVQVEFFSLSPEDRRCAALRAPTCLCRACNLCRLGGELLEKVRRRLRPR